MSVHELLKKYNPFIDILGKKIILSRNSDNIEIKYVKDDNHDIQKSLSENSLIFFKNWKIFAQIDSSLLKPISHNDKIGDIFTSPVKNKIGQGTYGSVYTVYDNVVQKVYEDLFSDYRSLYLYRWKDNEK